MRYHFCGARECPERRPAWRNVFTRRLYTLKGQQTFDENRRKYQTEPEFRQAVDRYCVDFERLMADVPFGVFLSGGLDSCVAAAWVRSRGRAFHAVSTHAGEDDGEQLVVRPLPGARDDHFEGRRRGRGGGEV